MGPPDSLYVRSFGAHTAKLLEDTVKTVKIAPLLSIICEGYSPTWTGIQSSSTSHFR